MWTGGRGLGPALLGVLSPPGWWPDTVNDKSKLPYLCRCTCMRTSLMASYRVSRLNWPTAVDFAADSGLGTTGDIRADLGLELPDHRPAAIWYLTSAVERLRMAAGRRTGGR